MRAVIQRVSHAQVDVDGVCVGSTPAQRPGLLVLLAAGKGDTEQDARYLAAKVAGLRVFEDDTGRMNLSVVDVDGGVLVVSQFTLYGDCRKGRRPSFVDALEPDAAEELIECFVRVLAEDVGHVETGRFRTHMEVNLLNDGPVTLLLDSRKAF